MQMPQLVRRVSITSACALLAGTLVACGSSGEDSPAPAPAADTAVAQSETKEATAAREASSSEDSDVPSRQPASPDPTASRGGEAAEPRETNSRSTSSEESDAEETSTNASEEGMNESVASAYEIFSPLLPREIFDQFSSCDPSAIEDTYDCSGPDVGQFQFYNSDTKATQTTQVLTELRSSHVVEDTGSRVVGWSTLGSTAILTVVDNDNGLVAQQMVSTDQVDPEERLAELGLA